MDINKCLEKNPNYYSDFWKLYHQACKDYNFLSPPPIDECSLIIYRHFSNCATMPIPLHAINLAISLQKKENINEIISSLKNLENV